MQFGFPPKYSKVIKFEGSKETLLPKIEVILNELKFNPKRTKTGLFGQTALGVMTWGEIITVDFVSEHEMRIQSSGKFLFPIFDYGANKKNVKNIIERIGV